MKTRSLAVAVLCLSTMLLFSFKEEKKYRFFCGFNSKTGYYGTPQKANYVDHRAYPGDRSGIPDVVEEIKKTLGIDVNIQVYIAKQENNCYATIDESGQRKLIADHNFLADVNKTSGTDWAAISIIAHEVGHHIAEFGWRPNRLDSELDADYWSGFVLKKLGADRSASVKCILRYGSEQDSYSHPNKYRRSSTIKKGWDDANNGVIDYAHCQDCEP